jgi:hypothetical protein
MRCLKPGNDPAVPVWGRENAENAEKSAFARIQAELRSWERARPGRRWPRLRDQPLARDTETDAYTLSVHPGFPRGRGKLRPGRARSRCNTGNRVQTSLGPFRGKAATPVK